MLLRRSSCVWTFNIILTTWHSVDGINADISAVELSHFGKGGREVAHCTSGFLQLHILVQCGIVSYGMVT